MDRILKEVATRPARRRHLQALLRIQTQDVDAFTKAFLENARRVFLCPRRDVGADRVLQVYESVISSDNAALGAALLEYALGFCNASNKDVRLRVVQTCAVALKGMDEIGEELGELAERCLLERAIDKVPAVRAAAAGALSRLQDSEDCKECPVVERLRGLASADSNTDVRRAAISALVVTRETLPDLLERTQDVSDTVRRAALESVAESVAPGVLSASQRDFLVSSGITDSSKSVRQATVMLLAKWLVGHRDSELGLLLREFSESVAEQAIASLFQLAARPRAPVGASIVWKQVKTAVIRFAMQWTDDVAAVRSVFGALDEKDAKEGGMVLDSVRATPEDASILRMLVHWLRSEESSKTDALIDALLPSLGAAALALEAVLLPPASSGEAEESDAEGKGEEGEEEEEEGGEGGDALPVLASLDETDVDMDEGGKSGVAIPLGEDGMLAGPAAAAAVEWFMLAQLADQSDEAGRRQISSLATAVLAMPFAPIRVVDAALSALLVFSADPKAFVHATLQPTLETLKQAVKEEGEEGGGGEGKDDEEVMGWVWSRALHVTAMTMAAIHVPKSMLEEGLVDELWERLHAYAKEAEEEEEVGGGEVDETSTAAFHAVLAASVIRAGPFEDDATTREAVEFLTSAPGTAMHISALGDAALSLPDGPFQRQCIQSLLDHIPRDDESDSVPSAQRALRSCAAHTTLARCIVGAVPTQSALRTKVLERLVCAYASVDACGALSCAEGARSGSRKQGGGGEGEVESDEADVEALLAADGKLRNALGALFAAHAQGASAPTLRELAVAGGRGMAQVLRSTTPSARALPTLEIAGSLLALAITKEEESKSQGEGWESEAPLEGTLFTGAWRRAAPSTCFAASLLTEVAGGAPHGWSRPLSRVFSQLAASGAPLSTAHAAAMATLCESCSANVTDKSMLASLASIRAPADQCLAEAAAAGTLESDVEAVSAIEAADAAMQEARGAYETSAAAAVSAASTKTKSTRQTRRTAKKHESEEEESDEEEEEDGEEEEESGVGKGEAAPPPRRSSRRTRRALQTADADAN